MDINVDSQVAVLTIHYDVDDHFINVDDFIAAANATKYFLSDLNRVLFKDSLGYEVVVLPALPGSLRERIGLKVYTTVAFLLGSMAGDVASGISKGLTGKSIEDIAQITTERLVDGAEHVLAYLNQDDTERFLVQATQGFLGKDTQALESAGITPYVLPDAFEAKDAFYQACASNPAIRGIGFTDHEEFPIPRESFPRFIAGQKPEDDEDEEWEWEITYTSVVSPNWDRSDKSRGWKGRHNDRDVYFTIVDENFWSLFETGQLVLRGKDSLKVQWAFVKDGDRRKRKVLRKVLRVLEYNGRHLIAPLTPDELDAVLKRHIESEGGDQGELFDNPPPV